jgi:hypothetical protein
MGTSKREEKNVTYRALSSFVHLCKEGMKVPNVAQKESDKLSHIHALPEGYIRSARCFIGPRDVVYKK